MVINDLQYSNKNRRMCDPLLSVLDYHRPDLAFMWYSDEEISENMFRRLLEKVKVPSVHGNHNNLEVLRELDILMKME